MEPPEIHMDVKKKRKERERENETLFEGRLLNLRMILFLDEKQTSGKTSHIFAL